MIYTFLKNAMKKHGRPVTTAEIEDYARETLPMCADHVVHHIVELERKGIVTKRFDKERKGYVWQPNGLTRNERGMFGSPQETTRSKRS